MSDLDCKKPKLCEPVPEPAPTPCSPAFNVCVGDRTLKWDGFCPTIERTRHTPDGTYTSVTVVDGCIVGYGYADEATYTPPYCNPNPTSCQGTGGVGNTTTTISPNTGNSITQTSSGLYSKTYINTGSGLAISGDGTQRSPYTITINSASSSGTTGVVVARNGLVHETDQNNVTYIGMEKVVTGGVYDNSYEYVIDDFGRIVSIKQRNYPLVQAGDGLTSHNQGDTLVIAHTTYGYDLTNIFGAYEVTADSSGHITGIRRSIRVNSGVYNLGAYNVGINEYGSITSISQRDDVLPSAGTFVAGDKEFSYDVTGRLVGVRTASNNNTGGIISSTPTSVRPIIDMYKFNFTDVGNINMAHTIDVYGSPIVVDANVTRTMTIPLPAYIVTQDQVQVNGATSWRIIPLDRLLEIKWEKNTPSFTVVFRG